MKRLLSLLWYAILMTMMWMIMGSPIGTLVYIFLLMAGSEELIVPFVHICAASLFAYHLYTGIKEKVV